MTKVIGFANIGDFDGYRYIATNHREDDNSGSYVALADYNQNIELQNNTIKAQQIEIETLKRILNKWLVLAPSLYCDVERINIQIDEVRGNTIEALK